MFTAKKTKARHLSRKKPNLSLKIRLVSAEITAKTRNKAAPSRNQTQNFDTSRLLNHRRFFRMSVSVNIIHNCHGDDDDVAGQAHPVGELAEEDQAEEGGEENL